MYQRIADNRFGPSQLHTVDRTMPWRACTAARLFCDASTFGCQELGEIGASSAVQRTTAPMTSRAGSDRLAHRRNRLSGAEWPVRPVVCDPHPPTLRQDKESALRRENIVADAVQINAHEVKGTPELADSLSRASWVPSAHDHVVSQAVAGITARACRCGGAA
jgi:hypothetical protein